jgi:NADH-quinone oxidoreductase subunit E
MRELGPSVRKRIDQLLTRYPVRQAAMLPVLHLMQEVYGSISDEAVEQTASILQVPPAAVYGVVSFYTLFKRPWEGKHTIWICATLPCALGGAERVFDRCKKILGVEKDGTTADRLFTLKKQECLAACDKPVCVQIDDDYYFNQSPETIGPLIETLRDQVMTRSGKEGA